MRIVEIDPVTRVEGHGKIVVYLDDDGNVHDTRFSVTEFRGFEKFCENRMLWDMPLITSRICGFCPVSHHLASVKACESLLGVDPPPAAKKVRELLHMGQFIHSHALHFFFFALPDFLGGDTPQANHRNIFDMLENNRNIATSAIKLRKIGQDIVDIVGGGRLHPVACIPGGMSKLLDYGNRVHILKGLVSGLKIAQMGVRLIKDLYAKNVETFHRFAAFSSPYGGMVKNEVLELYDGPIRLIDGEGKRIVEFSAENYLDEIEERVEPDSYAKFPYYGKLGYPEGCFRVGPLARLNLVNGITTPLAHAELSDFKSIGDGKPIHAVMFYHYARMIELLYAVERARELIYDPEILSDDIRVPVKRGGGEGIGAVEAPRGTLYHHYWANEDGKITRVNLVVATVQNNAAMNQSVRIVAEKIFRSEHVRENDLNRLEMAVRCFDPCLSCASHTYGKMPLIITLVDKNGQTLATYRYGDDGN